MAEGSNWERRTFVLDTVRSLPAGGLETISSTFAVYLAVAVFDAGATEKAILMASGSMGLLVSLFVVQAVRRIGCSLNTAASAVWGVSAIGFTIAAAGRDRLEWYLTGMIIGQMALVMAVPLFSHIYRKHYPGGSRGRLFALTSVVRKLAAIGAGILFGWWLERSLDNFPWLLAFYAGCCLAMILCVLAMKPVRLSKAREVKLFDAFRHVKKDQTFRRLLIAWMVLGIGNLLCFAVFVEYAANPVYGFGLGAAETSWLTTFTPEMAYLVTVFLWGMLFDRMNFFVLRVVINLFFIAGILTYFLGPAVWVLYVGIALHGVGKAGGNVAWSLWVTKFAKAEHVAEYMSVHTFLTGCRGTIAPLIAFQLIKYSPQMVGIIGGCLMTISTFMIWPQMKESLGKKG